MRYIVLPSFEYKDIDKPNLASLIGDMDIDIISGPTESELYIIEATSSDIEFLKILVHPYFIIIQDFDLPTIN